MCSQYESGDDLWSSSVIQIGDHDGAQIELTATVQVNCIPGLNANDKVYCIESSHEQSERPHRLHPSYPRTFGKSCRRCVEQRLGERPDKLDES